MFCNFYLVKNHEIANNATNTKAREKISIDLESLEFQKKNVVSLTKYKNYPIFITDNQAPYWVKAPHYGHNKSYSTRTNLMCYVVSYLAYPGAPASEIVIHGIAVLMGSHETPSKRSTSFDFKAEKKLTRGQKLAACLVLRRLSLVQKKEIDGWINLKNVIIRSFNIFLNLRFESLRFQLETCSSTKTGEKPIKLFWELTNPLYLEVVKIISREMRYNSDMS